jgi:hypothetical protein
VDRRSVRGSAVRAPAEADVPRPHLRGHAIVTPDAPLLKRRPPFPPRAATTAPADHRARHGRSPVNSPLPSSHTRATARAPSLDPLGPVRATCCPGRALAIVGTEPPLPALAVRPRWRLCRPDSSYPQGLGERVVKPHYLPGRERRRLAGIRPAPPPPQA